MEIGDVFVINKADREGVLRTQKELESLLAISAREDEWQPPIVKTVATESKGIEDLADAVNRCHEAQEKMDTGRERRQAIARWRILELWREQLLARALDGTSVSQRLDGLAAEVASKKRDPYSAVEELIRRSQ